MQSVACVEIKVGEGTLVKQVNPAYTSVKKMKLVVQEAEQKMKTWEENHHRLDKAVALSYINFAQEGIIEEMGLEYKVTRLGEIVEDIRKKVPDIYGGTGKTKNTP